VRTVQLRDCRSRLMAVRVIPQSRDDAGSFKLQCQKPRAMRFPSESESELELCFCDHIPQAARVRLPSSNSCYGDCYRRLPDPSLLKFSCSKQFSERDIHGDAIKIEIQRMLSSILFLVIIMLFNCVFRIYGVSCFHGLLRSPLLPNTKSTFNLEGKYRYS
jgi:hypothetical protein